MSSPTVSYQAIPFSLSPSSNVDGVTSFALPIHLPMFALTPHSVIRRPRMPVVTRLSSSFIVGAVSNKVKVILRMSSISKIFRPIIQLVSIKVSDYFAFGTRWKKDHGNKSVNLKGSRCPVAGIKKDNGIPLVVKSWLKDFPVGILTVGEDLPLSIDPIAVEAGYVLPVSVGHAENRIMPAQEGQHE